MKRHAVELAFGVFVALFATGILLRLSEVNAAEPRPATLTVTVTAEEFKALRREVAELRAEVERLKPTAVYVPNETFGAQRLYQLLPSQVYTAPDGCNTCFQDERGNVTACTALSCIDWPAKRWNIQEKSR